jgi:hypothetical protein
MRHLFLAALIVLLGGTAPAGAATDTREATSPGLSRQCDALLAQWKERFAAERFNAVAAPPFVVAGDASAAKLRRYTDGTVLAATRALRATYFKKKSAEPTLILLFDSAESYKRLAKKWFDDDDVPHYGFYRRQGNVMLMNISTGTGTLVHEMVHALMAPDFPSCPNWFNEGLASLYEQCSLDGDTIKGHANWRLPALQKAIREKTLRPLTELIADDHFYADDRVGINYAQARYLMMYLQEKGLLTRYYAAARDGAKEDPTARAALELVLERRPLAEFEADWRAWVMTLSFR